MNDLLLTEFLTKRGLLKLKANIPNDNRIALNNMISQSKSKKGISLLKVAAVMSDVQQFQALDIEKSLSLDLEFLTSIYHNNKSISNYILEENRLDLGSFNKYKDEIQKSYLPEFIKQSEKTDAYYKIVALLESGIDLDYENTLLNKLSDTDKSKLVKSAAKHGYGVAIKTLIENNCMVPLSDAFECVSNMKYKDDIKKNNLTNNICKKFIAIKENYSTSFIESLNNDLLLANNASDINLTIHTYSKINHNNNIGLDIDFTKIKQQKLNARPVLVKIKDFYKNTIELFKSKILKIPIKSVYMSTDLIKENIVYSAIKKSQRKLTSNNTQENQAKEVNISNRLKSNITTSSLIKNFQNTSNNTKELLYKKIPRKHHSSQTFHK